MVHFPAHVGLQDAHDSLTRLILYLAYNPLYAKESYKKQGMLFGRDRKPTSAASPNAAAARPEEATPVR